MCLTETPAKSVFLPSPSPIFCLYCPSPCNLFFYTKKHCTKAYFVKSHCCRRWPDNKLIGLGKELQFHLLVNGLQRAIRQRQIHYMATPSAVQSGLLMEVSVLCIYLSSACFVWPGWNAVPFLLNEPPPVVCWHMCGCSWYASFFMGLQWTLSESIS